MFSRSDWLSGGNLIGYGLAILSITVGVYLGFFRSEDKKDLHFAVDVASILVFDPNLTESFTLEPNVEKIIWSETLDVEPNLVWATTFAVWNSGDLAINPADILPRDAGQLLIEIGSSETPPLTIWELKAIATSRDEISFGVEAPDPEYHEGVVRFPVKFDILEKNDGGLFRLIYSGPENIPISLRGTIIGIPKQQEFVPATKLDWTAIFPSIMIMLSGVIFISYGSFDVFRAVQDSRLKTESEEVLDTKRKSVLPVWGAVTLGFGIWFIITTDLTTVEAIPRFLSQVKN